MSSDVNYFKQLLETAFPDAKISFSGSDCSFKLEITSERFTNINKVKRHALVYEVLGEFLRSGRIHALQIHAATPSEVS